MLVFDCYPRLERLLHALALPPDAFKNGAEYTYAPHPRQAAIIPLFSGISALSRGVPGSAPTPQALVWDPLPTKREGGY